MVRYVSDVSAGDIMVLQNMVLSRCHTHDEQIGDEDVEDVVELWGRNSRRGRVRVAVLEGRPHGLRRHRHLELQGAPSHLMDRLWRKAHLRTQVMHCNQNHSLPSHLGCDNSVSKTHGQLLSLMQASKIQGNT